MRISKRLVIDTAVARASGRATATHSVSKNCRDFLACVLDICHRIVMTGDVRDEWKRHESSFTRTWRVSMVARKKLVFLRPGADATLRKAIEELELTKAKRDAMIKDCHLVEAALASDKIVISLDSTARELFGAASHQIRRLRPLMWVNPTVDPSEVADWLQDGALILRNYLLFQ